MPRVLIVCEYPTLLGGERSMLATLPTVVAAGFEVQVVAPVFRPTAPTTSPLAEALRKRGVMHHPWMTHDGDGERLPLEQLRKNLEDIICDARPDLVHANSLSASRIAGPVTAELNVPSIGHLRDIINVSQQAIDDLNAHRRLITVSHATRHFHVANGISAARCKVMHNGVDLSQFHPRQCSGYLRDELQIPRSARLIATIGQLGPRKGTDVAISAAQIVLNGDDNLHWLFIGERTSGKLESKNFEAELHASLRVFHLEDRVHFLGTRNDVSHLLPECDLLVHAARQEPLGRVLLEAAASGVAVVATDVGGTCEIFPTEDDGAVLVPPDDIASLADAIVDVFSNEDWRRQLGASGRRRAERAFDIRNTAPQLVEHYNDVLI